MSISKTLYNAVFKRSSTFALAIISTTFFVERGIDGTADYLFNRLNEGKLWEHIKPE